MPFLEPPTESRKHEQSNILRNAYVTAVHAKYANPDKSELIDSRKLPQGHDHLATQTALSVSYHDKLNDEKLGLLLQTMVLVLTGL